MAFFTIKKLKGKEYVFLEERGWVNGQIKRTFQKYLGPRELLPNLPLGKKSASNIEDITIHKVLEFGLGAALWNIAQELELPKIIDEIIGDHKSPNLTTGEYLTLAAINRVDDPCSKTQLSDWFRHSWLSTQFNIDASILNAQTYWNHFQRLNADQFHKVELNLSKLIHSRFQLSFDRIMYDATNIFTFAKPDDDNGLRHFGHSKENRNGLPIVSYYLLCSKPFGIPLYHHTYAGNTQDAESFKTVPATILPHLEQIGLDISKITLCFDKGNLSPKGISELDSNAFKFIASLRNSTQKELLSIPSSRFTSTILPMSQKSVMYFKDSREIYGKLRTVFTVIDIAKQKKHQERFQEKFEEKVQSIQEFIQKQLNIKKWRDKSAVEMKLKALIGKRPWKDIILVSIDGDYEHLKVQLEINTAMKRNHEDSLGRSILFTNQDNWTPEEVIWGYREQYLVEHAFRTMKDPQIIAVRPIYHSNNKCIEAHIFICVLALFLLAVLRLKLSNRGINLSYDQIILPLRRLHATQIRIKGINKTYYKLETSPTNTVKFIKLLHLDGLLKEESQIHSP